MISSSFGWPRTRAAGLFVSAVLGLAFASSAAHAQNLLQNGSFESSTFNDSYSQSSGFGYVSPSPSSDSRAATVPSWTWTADPAAPTNSSTFALNATGGSLGVTAEDGNLSVSFGTGSPSGGGSIAQNFTPTSGSLYLGSLYVRRIGAGQTIGAAVTIKNNVDGSTVTTVPINMSGMAANQWNLVTFSFTAPSANLSFVFKDTTQPGAADSTDLGLDNVSIVPAEVQTLTILGGSGNTGDIAANTEYSTDNGATWHPAYLAGQHPWGNINGTNSWINQAPNLTQGLYQTTLFRVRFNAPTVMSSPSMTFTVNADNIGVMSINGHQLSTTYGGYPPYDTRTLGASYIVPGQNTINVALTDEGGLVGINYRVDLQAVAAQPITVVQLPPVITSTASASGTVGTSFAYTIKAGNNPTSFGAANLPAGLSVNATTGVVSGTPTAIGTYNTTISAANSAGTTPATLTITINKGTASVTLGSLSQVYDGTVKSATATTNPSNLSVAFSYSGPSLPPINAGIYGVFASVNDANYSGSASGNLTVSAAPLAITLGNLTQSFDGTPKSVSVTTSPSGVATSVTYNGSTTAPSAIGSYAVAATVANPNYSGSANATLTIKDTTPPVLTLPANIATEATGPNGATVTFSVTANDNVDGAVAVTTTPASGSVFPLGTTTVTATAHDAAGNVATGSFTVTVGDTTAPAIATTANLTLEATSANGAIATFTPTATDLVSGAVSVTASPASGSTFPLGTTAVTLTAKDAAGNTATSSFTVTVQDTTAPVISVTTASDFTENFNGYTNGLPYYPQYQSGLQQEYQGDVPGWSKSGFHAVHAVNLDGQGNWAVMIWQDNVITSIGTTADNASGADYVVHFNAGPAVSADPSQATSATDGLLIKILRADNTVLSQFTYLPGAWAGAPALVPVSFHYTGDGSGAVHMSVGPSAPNSGRFGGTIDDISITPSTPANITLEATSPAGAAATWGAAAYDLVSGSVAVTASPASGSVFPLGTTAVALSATDAHGNTATSSFTVTVRDTTPPTLTVPANQTLEATGPNGAVATFAATATDAATAQPAIAYSIASGSTFALGTTTVNVTATDDAGNVSSGSFTITVKDTTPPAIATPANIVAEATNANGAAVTFGATATDIVSGPVPVTASPASGSVFPLGTTTVTLTAKDAAGNTATTSFTVTVRDTTPPTIATPANLVAEATSPNGAVVTFNPTATDIVSGAVAVMATPASGSTFALGATKVTLTAKDAAGNVATSAFTVTVRDTTPPALTVPANQVLEATSAAGAVATFAASATDAVTASPAIAYSAASGSTFALGTNTVTVTATDAAGNQSTGTFTITVRDTTAPALAIPVNQVLEATSAAGAVANYTATATDAVTASPAIAYSIAPGSTFALGTTTVTVTATDAAGNVSTGSFTVTVRDTTAPTISSLTASPNSIWPPNKKMVAVTITAGTTDLVGVASVKIISVATNEPDGNTQWQITGPLTLNLRADRLGTGTGRIYTITVEARDAAGNASTKTVTVTVPHDQR